MLVAGFSSPSLLPAEKGSATTSALLKRVMAGSVYSHEGYTLRQGHLTSEGSLRFGHSDIWGKCVSSKATKNAFRLPSQARLVWKAWSSISEIE